MVVSKHEQGIPNTSDSTNDRDAAGLRHKEVVAAAYPAHPILSTQLDARPSDLRLDLDLEPRHQYRPRQTGTTMLFSKLALFALVPAAFADWGNLCSSDRKAKVLIGNGPSGVTGELIFFQRAWSDVVTLTGTVSHSHSS